MNAYDCMGSNYFYIHVKYMKNEVYLQAFCFFLYGNNWLSYAKHSCSYTSEFEHSESDSDAESESLCEYDDDVVLFCGKGSFGEI